MPTIADIRARYPQYHDLSDQQLADGLYRKFYSDMPRAEFDAKIGFSDGKASGIGRNVTAGMNEAIYGTLGLPVDLAKGAINLGVRGINAVTGADLPQVPEDAVGGSKWIGETLGHISPALNPETTAATTPGEKIARGAGMGAAAMLAPEAALGVAERAGAPQLAERAAKLFGRSSNVPQAAANALVGAAGGAGASVGEQGAPDNMKPLAATVGGLAGGGLGVAAASVPTIAREGVNLAREAIAPFTREGTRNLAARQLREAATEPAAVRDSLANQPEPLVPRSDPTTFQLTGDMGLGALERGSQAKFPEAFNQRRADQNAARTQALRNLQAKGSPEQVANAVRRHIDAIDAETQAALDNATSAARERANALGTGKTPEVAGAELRDALETARAAAKEKERSLWNAVDPDGTLALPINSTRITAQKIARGKPVSAGPLEPIEQEIHAIVGQYGPNVPFKELTALQSRLKTAMRQERLASGDSPAYRRMTQLNAAIHDDIDNAVTNKVIADQRAVAAGRMSVDDTLAARLLHETEAWRARRETTARFGSGGSASAAGAARTSPIFGAHRAEGQTFGGLGNAPGNPRLSADAANFDEDALGRLNTAREATKNRAATYDNPTLGPLLKRPATTSPYNVSDAAVAGRLFTSGPAAFEKIQIYRKAVGDPEALKSMENYAVDRLRGTAMNPDGTLDPAKVQSWRRAHKDALRAFPALDRKLADAQAASETMGEVAARRRQALKDSQQGAVGRIMGLDHPDDVTRAVGSLFGRQDSLKQVASLRKAIGGDKQAQEGLRKAVADYIANRFVGNTEAATSGRGTVKSDQLQTFVKNNRNALRVAGFSEEEVHLLDRLAQDLQRSNRSIASIKLPGGSNTTQDILQVQKSDRPATMFTKILGNIGMAGGGASGGFGGAAVGHAIGQALGSIRQSGLDTVDAIVADAMLNPQKAKMLLSRPSPKNEIQSWKLLGQIYKRSAAVTAANEGTDGK